MREILQTQFLNNTVQLYLEVFGVILIAFIIKRILSKYLAGLLFLVFSKSDKKFRKKEFIELIVGPLDTFLFVLIIIIAMDKLTMPAILNLSIYKATIKDVLDAVVHTALIFSFIRLCVRIVKFLAIIFEEKANLTTDQSDNQLVVFFRDFFKVIIYIIGVLLVLRFTFNYDIGNLITGLSIVGAAIALATKESLENLIASFIIFFDKPFTTGDMVKVQGFTGNVERIGLRSTRIRTDHKTYITVPNKQMVDTILDNITQRTQRRAEIKLEIGLSATAAQLKKIIPAIKSLLQQGDVESSTVFLSDTGRNAHIITVEYFTGMHQDINEFNSFREEINFKVIELLSENNIELAAASTDVTVKQSSADIPLNTNK